MTRLRNISKEAVLVDGYKLEAGEDVWVSDRAAEDAIRAVRTLVVVL